MSTAYSSSAVEAEAAKAVATTQALTVGVSSSSNSNTASASLVLSSVIAENISTEAKNASKEFKETKASKEEKGKGSYPEIKEALAEFYARQDRLGSNSIDGKDFSIANVRLALVEEQREKRETASSREVGTLQDDKESKANSNKDHEHWYLTRKKIEIQNLFEVANDRIENGQSRDQPVKVKKILVLGAVGSGKTTLTQYIAYQWSKSCLWQDRFKYVFWIKLRNLTNYAQEKSVTAKDIIFAECFIPKTRHESEVQSLKADIEAILITQKEQCLLVLDGLEEIIGKLSDPKELVVKKVFAEFMECPNAVVTSRPNGLCELRGFAFDRKLENCGFGPEQITAYVRDYFADQKAQEAVLKWIESQEVVKGLVETPVNLMVVCALYASGRVSSKSSDKKADSNDVKESKETKSTKEEKSSPEINVDLVSLYRELIRYLIVEHHLKEPNSTDSIAEIEIRFAAELEYLGRLAYGGLRDHGQAIIHPNIFEEVDKELRDKTTAMTQKEEKAAVTVQQPTQNEGKATTITQDMPKYKGNALKMGLLRPVNYGSSADRYKPHEFLHSSLQEYFAAWYLVQQLKSKDKNEVEKAKLFFRVEKYNPTYYMVFNFVAGLVHLEDESILKVFWEELLHEPLDLTGIGHVGLMIRCLDAGQLDKRIPNLDRRVNEIRQWLQNKIYDNRDYYGSDVVFDKVFDNFFVPVLRDSTILMRGRICDAIFIKALEFKVIRNETLADSLMAINKLMIKDTANSIHMMSAHLKARKLEANQYTVKPNVLDVISKIGWKAATPELLRWIIQSLQAKEEDTITIALYAAGEIGEKAAVPEILGLIAAFLGSEVKAMRTAILFAIKKIGEKAATREILKWLAQLLNEKRDVFIEEKDALIIEREILPAIRGIGAKAATPEILDGIDRLLLPIGHRSLRLITLNELEGTPEMLENIARSLEAKEKNVRETAFCQVQRIGAKAATPEIMRVIAQSLEAEEKDIREAALNAIQGMGEKAATPKILTWIDQSLEAKEKDTREAALHVIMSIGAKAATPVVHKWVSQALDSKEKDTREAALHVVNSIGAAAATPEVLRWIGQSLDSKEKDTKETALNAIQGMGEKAATPEMIELFLASTEVEEMKLIDAIHYMLKIMGVKAVMHIMGKWITKSEKLRLDWVIRPLEAKEADIKIAALDLITMMGAVAAFPEILKGLARSLEAKEAEVRRAALNAIGRIGEKAAIPEILNGIAESLRAGKEWEERTSAVQAIRNIGVKAATPKILQVIIYDIIINNRHSLSIDNVINYLLTISLRELLLHYCNLPSDISTFPLVYVALLQGKAIAIIGDNVGIYDNRQTDVVSLPQQSRLKRQVITKLVQAFVLTLSENRIPTNALTVLAAKNRLAWDSKSIIAESPCVALETTLSDQVVRINLNPQFREIKDYKILAFSLSLAKFNESIRYLDLSNNGLGDHEVFLMALDPERQFLKTHPQIQTLILSNNCITSKGLEYLLQAIIDHHLSLSFLYLDHNLIAFDSTYCKRLDNMLNSTNLQCLDLSMNFIHKGAMVLETFDTDTQRIVYRKKQHEQILGEAISKSTGIVDEQKLIASAHKERIYCKLFFRDSPIARSIYLPQATLVQSIIAPDEKYRINNEYGAIALLANKVTVTGFGEHAYLAIERVHKYGQRSIIVAEMFADKYGSSSNSTGEIKISVRYYEPKEFLERTHEGKRVHVRTAIVPKQQIKKLLETILTSRSLQNFYDYEAFPGDSRGIYNCLKWAAEMLQSLGIIKDYSTWIPSREVNIGSCVIL